MKIATGVRRLGSGIVNVYLLEEAGQVTVIDAGAPGYWNDLQAELAAMGRSLADVRAVVLTHAHSDHIGFAERIRRERKVPISVHELDAALARAEAKAPRDPALNRLSAIRPAILSFLWLGIREGMLRRIPPVTEVSTFGDGATLDVPGAPRVIHMPGHSEGSAALFAPSRDALFIGDAIATYNVMSGRRGPQLAPFGGDLRQAVASLDRLSGIEAGFVLPGHGTPWTGGVTEAVRLVRASVR